ncbi:MAG: transcriptional regulator [Frankiales bacterium]|nr:transcriptional regulator [Frankiales bacterium]
MTDHHLIRVLLVEDSLADIELTLEALEEAKFVNEVQTVRDGAEALDALHRRGAHVDAPRPDLIILDLNLPKRSGHEVLADLKADDDLRRIPVAVLTTSAAERDVLRSYDLGANCYLTKPVDVAQFLEVVQSIEDFWFGVVRLPPR